jgi:small subunit ribosomal protein S13e|tara:strand:+ start:96 stop:551 length:456 start_codon:yes stop_codon:yes gene_type:complete
MGRMYGRGKGMSKSSLPYRKVAPKRITVEADEIVTKIAALAKKGFMPSKIGVILRDSFAIPQSHLITGSKILRILKKKGIAPEFPEDLYCLMRKAVQIRKHIEKNNRDRDSKYRLILVESKIHRLARYYKLKKQVPSTWKYSYKTALALVS